MQMLRAIVAAVLGLLVLAWPGGSKESAASLESLRLAAQKIRAKDFAAAEDILDKVLREEPGSAVAENLLGVCELQTGRYQAAQKSFEKAIELNPKLPEPRVNLGNMLLGLHEEGAAMSQFKAALAIDPAILSHNASSYSAFNVLGLCLADDGKYSEAQRAFEHSIRINPKFAPAHLNLGNTLLALKQERAALKEFLTALAIQPKDPNALFNIGLIYGREGKVSSAEEYLRKAHDLAPDDNAISVALAGAQISSGKKEAAESLITQLRQEERLDPKAKEELARLWLENNEPGKGVELIRDAPDAAPRFYQSGLRKAETDFENARYAEAAKTLEAIRTLATPDASFHDLLGSVYYALDDPRKASDELQEAVRLEPADADHYFKLGMVFLKHRTPEPAIYIYQTALKTRPDVPKLWLGLGLSYYFASRLQDAEQALRKALELDPRYEVAYVVLGDLFEQSGRIDEAIAIFARAIEINPHLYLPYYYYGKLASKEGGKRIGEAIEKLQKTVALDPTFADAHYELGKALAQTGRPEEAVRELKRSLELNPSLAEAHYQLGLVYKKLGDPTRSAEQLRLFQATNREESPGDLIQRLEVQIEKK
jgi:tetratricopeptide (TPR) repeat protein